MRSTLHTHGVPLHQAPVQHQQPPRQAALTRRGIEPGQQRTVELVDYAGARVVHGFRGQVRGPLDPHA